MIKLAGSIATLVLVGVLFSGIVGYFQATLNTATDAAIAQTTSQSIIF